MTIDDLDVRVSRGSVKRVTITVRPPEGEIVVRCPVKFPQKELIGVLRARVDWMRASQASVRARFSDEALLRRSIESGESLEGIDVMYLGDRFVLRIESVDDLKRGSIQVNRAKGVIELRLPVEHASDPKRQQAWIDRLYRQTLEELLPECQMKWERQLGVRAAGVRFRSMKSRWGSCRTDTRTLTINTRLARHDPKFFDYVVLHELVHLRVPNHGPDFYHLMSRHLPEWKALREALKTLPF